MTQNELEQLKTLLRKLLEERPSSSQHTSIESRVSARQLINAILRDGPE